MGNRVEYRIQPQAPFEITRRIDCDDPAFRSIRTAAKECESLDAAVIAARDIAEQDRDGLKEQWGVDPDRIDVTVGVLTIEGLWLKDTGWRARSW